MPAPWTQASARGPYDCVVKNDLVDALSRQFYVMENARTPGLGHMCAAFDIDPCDKARLVTGVDHLLE